MKVESIPVHDPRSTIISVSPADIRASPNDFTQGLLRKDPFPSHRIQLNPLKIPTEMKLSAVTVIVGAYFDLPDAMEHKADA
jgi:hypothetical protein